jgi:triphosphoribosyl-dephospho-CoA synthase
MYDICKIIGRYALKSMLYEVSATPKPGLVDRNNNGAHKDMDFFSFMSSSAALAPYFTECAMTGAKFQGGNACELFRSLRPLGIAAEKQMLIATGNVNTHKGLIFSLGLISAAAAFCWKDKGTARPDINEICDKVSLMTVGLCSRELQLSDKSDGLSNGEKVFKKFGAKGIRGEVEGGFPTVRKYSLPVLTALCREKSLPLNDILVHTLLHIMTVNEDTNILARHDTKILNYVKEYSAKVLGSGGMLTEYGRKEVYEMDRRFIKDNISPGGSADLLAVTVMFYLLSCNIRGIFTGM